MPGLAEWSYELGLPAEPGSAARAREFVCLHLAAHGMSHLAEDARLVVSELATNAVTHAGTPFSVTMSSGNGWMRLAISDESRSVPVQSTPDAMDTHGRGLMIVELLSQEWGVQIGSDGFKAVWASFATAAPSVAGAA